MYKVGDEVGIHPLSPGAAFYNPFSGDYTMTYNRYMLEIALEDNIHTIERVDVGNCGASYRLSDTHWTYTDEFIYPAKVTSNKTARHLLSKEGY